MLNIKERIVVAVLRDIHETNGNEEAFNDMTWIQMKMNGYEELVEKYSKQIIELLNKEENSD